MTWQGPKEPLTQASDVVAKPELSLFTWNGHTAAIPRLVMDQFKDGHPDVHQAWTENCNYVLKSLSSKMNEAPDSKSLVGDVVSYCGGNNSLLKGADMSVAPFRPELSPADVQTVSGDEFDFSKVFPGALLLSMLLMTFLFKRIALFLSCQLFIKYVLYFCSRRLPL